MDVLPDPHRLLYEPLRGHLAWEYHRDLALALRGGALQKFVPTVLTEEQAEVEEAIFRHLEDNDIGRLL